MKNLLLFLFLTSSIAIAQNPKLIVYNSTGLGLPGNRISEIAIDKNNIKWFGIGKELAKFDDTNFTVYDSLPQHGVAWANGIGAIVIDSSGNKWLGSWNCLLKFDDTRWTIYDNFIFPSTGHNTIDAYITTICIDDSSSIWIGSLYGGLYKFKDTIKTLYANYYTMPPIYYVTSIAIDKNNNKWIGCLELGLVKYDGSEWTTYDTTNSGLPDNSIVSIAIDYKGNKWIGTYDHGLVKFDDSAWTVYNTSNSGLPNDSITSIAIDHKNNTWIKTDKGKLTEFNTWSIKSKLTKFDGNTWSTYDSIISANGIDYIGRIAIDKYDNKWFGTNIGLAVFNENGVVTSVNRKDIPLPNTFTLSQNYPNPFNPTTTINYSLPESGLVTLIIYDILGREISTLVNEEKTAGNYSVQFSGSNLSTGIYFYRMQSGNFVQIKKLILLK